MRVKIEITNEIKNRDNYREFAVDGVLLYASYLSKDFDVLAIDVSGETKQYLNISHFLHLKNERQAVEIFSNKLLPAQDYFKQPRVLGKRWDLCCNCSYAERFGTNRKRLRA